MKYTYRGDEYAHWTGGSRRRHLLRRNRRNMILGEYDSLYLRYFDRPQLKRTREWFIRFL